jgi:hypothetical protein
MPAFGRSIGPAVPDQMKRGRRIGVRPREGVKIEWQGVGQKSYIDGK